MLPLLRLLLAGYIPMMFDYATYFSGKVGPTTTATLIDFYEAHSYPYRM